MLRATAIVVDNADVIIECRSFLGGLFLGGGSGVAFYRGYLAIAANHIGSVASGLHLKDLSFPIDVDIVRSGRDQSGFFVKAAATGSKVVVYVSK